MARTLKFGRRAAQSGTPKSLVVFLHGYGADGADLLSLGEALAPHLPDTSFVAPDAPDRVPGAPYGYQWASIPRFDGSSEEQAQAARLKSSEDIAAFLKQRAEYEKLPLSACAVVGFSQGAMMSLLVAPTLAEPLAAVVAIAGWLVQPEGLAARTVSRPPVMLIHGDQDEVVSPESLTQAGNALSAAGFDTYAHVMKGSGHGIAQDGLQVTLQFLQNFLPK